MAFNIREVTIHLEKAQAPCMPASPDPACKDSAKPDDNKPGGGKPGDKPGGGKKRNLSVLLAQLRETLAPSPL